MKVWLLSRWHEAGYRYEPEAIYVNEADATAAMATAEADYEITEFEVTA